MYRLVLPHPGYIEEECSVEEYEEDLRMLMAELDNNGNEDCVLQRIDKDNSKDKNHD